MVLRIIHVVKYLHLTLCVLWDSCCFWRHTSTNLDITSVIVLSSSLAWSLLLQTLFATGRWAVRTQDKSNIKQCSKQHNCTEQRIVLQMISTMLLCTPPLWWVFRNDSKNATTDCFSSCPSSPFVCWPKLLQRTSKAKIWNCLRKRNQLNYISVLCMCISFTFPLPVST